jgi:YqjK-like protein
MKSAESFAQRRVQITLVAARQRAALGQQIQDWRRALEIANRAWAVLRYIKSRPLLFGVPFGLFMIRRSNLLLRWVGRGWLVKELIQKLFAR